MPVKFDVLVAGQKLSLIAEDDEIIKISAEEVNRQVSFIKSKQPEAPAGTLPLLAALNLAEQNHNIKLNNQAEINFCVSELNKMANYLQNCLVKSISKNN